MANTKPKIGESIIYYPAANETLPNGMTCAPATVTQVFDGFVHAVIFLSDAKNVHAFRANVAHRDNRKSGDAFWTKEALDEAAFEKTHYETYGAAAGEEKKEPKDLLEFLGISAERGMTIHRSLKQGPVLRIDKAIDFIKATYNGDEQVLAFYFLGSYAGLDAAHNSGFPRTASILASFLHR